MSKTLTDAVKATGMTERQLFHEAYFDFAGERSPEAMNTANRYHDEYASTNRLPGWAGVYCQKRINQSREPRTKATKMVRELVHSGAGDNDQDDGA
ncbi:MAG TPA: hypothetical protein V6D19_13120 [Stenomitos sp.]